MLKLIDADASYLPQYKEAYLETLKEIEKKSIKQHNLMFMNPEEKDIVQMFMDNRDSSKLPENYVPSYDYFAVDNQKFIGIIHIRIQLTERLLRYGGHIGYAINPKYWRQGYGTELLRIGLIKAKDLIEEDKILITCDDDNIGSSKIIEKNGGVIENKVENEDSGEHFITRRYWIKNDK